MTETFWKLFVESLSIIVSAGAFALFAYGTLANHARRGSASTGNLHLAAAGIGSRTGNSVNLFALFRLLLISLA